MPSPEDHVTSPVRMDQAMLVMATALVATINTFIKDEDDEKTQRNLSWVAISIFLHQLLMASKHKDIAIKVREALIVELKDAKPV